MIRLGAILFAVTAEALALYTLAEWFAAGYETDRQAVPWWAFVIVALAAFTVPRVTQWFALPERASYLVLGGSAFIVVYGLIRITYGGDVAIWDFGWIPAFIEDSDAVEGKGSHAVISTFLLLFLWVRQSIRSVDDMDLEAMPRAIGPLFAGVTIVAVLGAMTGRAGEVGRGAAGFYAVAIPALAFAQLALSGVTLGQVRAGGITATLLGATLAATVACVVVAAVALAVLGPIIGPPLDRGLEIVLTIILTPPAIVLAWFFDLIFPDQGFEFPVQDVAERSDGEEEPGEEDDSWSLKQVSAAGFRTVLVLGIILLAVGAVAYFMRLRRRVQEREEGAPVRAAVGSLRDDFAGLWRSWRPGWGRREEAVASSGVSRLYRDVLQEAERSGHPRRPAETPHEFAPVLESTFHRPVTDEITYAYEQARYAGREPDAATLALLEQRWRESS